MNHITIRVVRDDLVRVEEEVRLLVEGNLPDNWNDMTPADRWQWATWQERDHAATRVILDQPIDTVTVHDFRIEGMGAGA